MSDLTITLVQANQIWEDKFANFENYARLLQGVTTDLVVLPEMFQTAFTMQASSLAETMEQSESIAWLKTQAAKMNAAFYSSLIIREDDRYYNRGVFVFPSGEIATYDKRKLFGMGSEDQYYHCGEKETLVHYRGWNINLQICYDLRFPENVRNSIEHGNPRYDLILYVANWPERRSHHWSTLLTARAIENQCYVAGVNRVGTDANALTYSGDSAVYNLLGELLSSFEKYQERVETCTLSLLELTETREKLPFLKDV